MVDIVRCIVFRIVIVYLQADIYLNMNCVYMHINNVYINLDMLAISLSKSKVQLKF